MPKKGRGRGIKVAATTVDGTQENADEVRSSQFSEKQIKTLKDLKSKAQDYAAKLETSQQSVNELRQQVDATKEEIKRLQEQSVINSKVDEILKELALDFEETFMKKKKIITTIIRDHAMRTLDLETSLNEKTEELKIANSTISQLNQKVNSLNAKAKDLTAKLICQEILSKVYEKKLQDKTKLADLYKASYHQNVAQA